MNKKGFTMIELLVAVAIMGVMTIIAIPSVKYIQRNNSNSKYSAYEKAIKSASKAYFDSFDEDLFGEKNTGCVKIKYSELKEKDLVQDIQLKDIKCDNDDETFIYVLKNKSNSLGFFSNIVCRNGTQIVYKNSESDRDECNLDDGKGPEVTVSIVPTQDEYYLGVHPTGSIFIEDKGVGLKAKQKLNYKWVIREGSEDKPVIEKIAKFNNIMFDTSATSELVMPNEDDIKKSVDYYLIVTGTVYDANSTPTQVNTELPLKYVVGNLIIQMKAGSDARLVEGNHNTDYFIDSEGYIVRRPNDRNISKIRYGESGNLWNYNNPEYINLEKPYHHIDDGEEWKDSKGKTYSQSEDLTPKSFGFKDDEVIKDHDETVVVEANWKKNKYKLTYDNNGGTGCAPVTKEYGEKWGPLCTPTRDGYKFTGWTGVTANEIVNSNKEAVANWLKTVTISATDQSKTYDGTALTANSTCSKIGGSLNNGDTITCTCTGSQTAVGSSAKILSSVVIKNSNGENVSNKYDIVKRNGTLTVIAPAPICNNVIKGTIQKDSPVTFADEDWTVVNLSNDYVYLALNGKVDNNGSKTGTVGGTYNNAQTAVGKWINSNSTLKEALANDCISNEGSSSNYKNNSPSNYYWLTSKSVYVPEQVNRWTVTNQNFFAGYKRVKTEPGSLELNHAYASSKTSTTVYSVGATATLNNNNSTISFENDTIKQSQINDIYANNGFMFIDAVNGKMTGKPEYSRDNDSKTMITKVWKRTNTGALISTTVVENTKTYIIVICGGSKNGQEYTLTAKSKTEYKHKAPGESEHTTLYSDNDKDYRFIFGGYVKSTHTGKSPSFTKTFDIKGASSICNKVTTYSLASTGAKQVYYRPYIKVKR